MFLTRLTITANQEIKRDISFCQGMNFIVDSETKASTDSGNSVGKTTLLRVIDYCFASDGKDIYQDKEFKSENNREVITFFRSHDVVARLEVQLPNHQTLVLERNFIVEKGKKRYRINNASYSSFTKYQSALETILLKNNASKPTIREIMPKFIRSTPEKMSNSLKFLHSTTTPEKYEPVFLFLFGFRETELFDKKSSAAGHGRPKAEARSPR